MWGLVSKLFSILLATSNLCCIFFRILTCGFEQCAWLTNIGDICPVIEVCDSTALEVPLDLTPRVLGGLVVGVVLQVVGHGCRDGLVRLSQTIHSFCAQSV